MADEQLESYAEAETKAVDSLAKNAKLSAREKSILLFRLSGIGLEETQRQTGFSRQAIHSSWWAIRRKVAEWVANGKPVVPEETPAWVYVPPHLRRNNVR
jgi:predicted DNA-binding protein (UPF0251 family)